MSGKSSLIAPDTGERPNIYDLKWEIIRRNVAYRNDRERTNKDLMWAFEPVKIEEFHFDKRLHYIKYKWGVDWLADPSQSWEDTFMVTPVKKGTELRIHRSPCAFTLNAIATSPVIFQVGDGQDVDQHMIDLSLFTNKPREDYLQVNIDPTANLETIKKMIERFVLDWRNSHPERPPLRRKIKERIGWLKLVDLVEAKPSSLTHNTFTTMFPNGQQHRSKMISYCKGKILIDDPHGDPLRSISDDKIRTYQIARDLIIPNK